ncbi:MAG: TRCF domain-containing protein, partial [bacterium]
DVKFHDLGLLIVDEEQRFGVKHKERLKFIKTDIDVLTLTATPIPRTLNMSLIGLRDISLIETPPEDRKAVKTFVEEWNMQSLYLAVDRELARGGQVYYVHNQIETIHQVRAFLEGAFANARIAVCHGKMPERELEKAMIKFLAHEYDVLLCTTIIENGLDIPNVNTLVVAGAENFGLSQLYQLRGRVGRSYKQSYSYFFYSPHRVVTEKAQKRLEALRDFAELGSGYRLAMRDLEIRGAGNLLGKEQHGYITEVGFNLYCSMLSESVQKLKGKPIEALPRVEVELGLSAYLPDSYIEDAAQRTSLYKRILSVRTEQQLDAVVDEMTDRYGESPEPAVNFVLNQRIKLFCFHIGIARIRTYRDSELTDIFFRDKKGIELYMNVPMPQLPGIEIAFLKDRIRLLHRAVKPRQVADSMILILKDMMTSH